jgi:hypothetical protein
MRKGFWLESQKEKDKQENLDMDGKIIVRLSYRNGMGCHGLH